MAADVLHVGLGVPYIASTIFYAIVLAVVFRAWYLSEGTLSILAFWLAYVVTRPLGASFADWLAVSPERGGLALGTGPVSLVLAAMIAGFVAYLTATGKDTPAELRAPRERMARPRPGTAIADADLAPEEA